MYCRELDESNTNKVEEPWFKKLSCVYTNVTTVRDAIPWAQVRANVISNFLDIDEPTALQDWMQPCMTWVAEFRERKDAVSRLGVDGREEVQMEIGAQPFLSANRLPPAPTLDSTLEQVICGQERLMTKLATMETASHTPFPRPSPRGMTAPALADPTG